MEPPADAITYEEASIEIHASPRAVYDLVSDLARMGEWSPENVGGEWRDGGSGQVGDWFVGHNRTPDREWTREVQVAVADIGREFTFVVNGIDANTTWWSYRMEPSPTEGRTTLTERWWIVNKTPAMAAATPEQFQQRIELTRTMLASTVAAVKAAAEQN